jgi:hypothetical protein
MRSDEGRYDCNICASMLVIVNGAEKVTAPKETQFQVHLNIVQLVATILTNTDQ